MKIAFVLKELRMRKGLQQEQVARSIGVDKSTLSAYENDRRRPSYEALVRLADLYKVSTDYLLDKTKGRTLDLSDLTEDEVTLVRYKTSAPYFKVGIDRNLLKNKHGPNRLYVGLRYAYTSYKVDITRPGLTDPVWHWDALYEIKDASCKMHWA